MTKSDAKKKPAGKNVPEARKSDAEMKEKELEQIAGGVELAKPTNPHRKKPNMIPPFS